MFTPSGQYTPAIKTRWKRHLEMLLTPFQFESYMSFPRFVLPPTRYLVLESQSFLTFNAMLADVLQLNSAFYNA